MLAMLPLVFVALVQDSADTVQAADVVVTGGRGRQQRTESPVLVSTVQAKALASVQASSLADGLSPRA
jgi:outer membrane cobalamin receptor